MNNIPDEEIKERIEEEKRTIEALEEAMEVKKQYLDGEITVDEALEREAEISRKYNDDEMLL